MTMKTKLKFILALLVIGVIFIGAYFLLSLQHQEGYSEEELPLEITSETKKCNTDLDCVMVEDAECCGCGWAECINKKFESSWKIEKKTKCELVECPPILYRCMAIPYTECKCVNNRCIIWIGDCKENWCYYQNAESLKDADFQRSKEECMKIDDGYTKDKCLMNIETD